MKKVRTNIFYSVLYCFLISQLGLICSCSKDYDDSSLKKWVNSLDQRVATLEQAATQINSNVDALSLFVHSIQDGKIIEKVTPSGKGFIILFSDQSSIEIVNGTDGTNGRIGINGIAPIIGIEEIEGVYYWTVCIEGTKSFLLDQQGKRMPIGIYGSNGTSGKDGKDGLAPLFRIDSSGYWEVSYDRGDTYTYLLDDHGKKVYALSDKTTTLTEISFVDHDDYLTICFPDGSLLDVEKYETLSFSLSPDYEVRLGSDRSGSVSYRINNSKGMSSIAVLEKGNIEATIYEADSNSGIISVKATGPVDSETKLLVFVYTLKRTIMKVLTVS